MTDFIGILLLIAFVSMVGASQGNRHKWQEMKRRFLSIPGVSEGVRASETAATKPPEGVKPAKPVPAQLWEMHDSFEGTSFGEGPQRGGDAATGKQKTTSKQAKLESKPPFKANPAVTLASSFNLTDTGDLARAIIMSEILGKPKALRKK